MSWITSQVRHLKLSLNGIWGCRSRCNLCVNTKMVKLIFLLMCIFGHNASTLHGVVCPLMIKATLSKPFPAKIIEDTSTNSCLLFSASQWEARGFVSGYSLWSGVCGCTCSDEDVARPCRKTSFEDRSASKLTVLLTCHFQSTVRKIWVPFFTNRCYQKLDADHKSLVQKAPFQISAVKDLLMSVEVCVWVYAHNSAGFIAGACLPFLLASLQQCFLGNFVYGSTFLYLWEEEYANECCQM